MNDFLSLKQVAEYINRTPGAVRMMVLRRVIPYRKPQGRLLFDRNEIDRWIEASPGISVD